MKTACLTVFYDGMQQFIDEYLQCIVDQTFKDFTLVIVNDGFPGYLDSIVERVGIQTIILDASNSPQQNRLQGMQRCKELGFDIIICSDSDETMYPDRIEHNIRYFEQHPHRDIVFNNSVGVDNNNYFDLFLKRRVEFTDIIDFNVLGYGALNLRTTLVPFIVNLANESVGVFDWWLGLRYLIEHKDVEVLEYARNYYRAHEGNFIGPVYEITENNIQIGLQVKEAIYTEMHEYCLKHNRAFMSLFKVKLEEISGIKVFIEQYSLQHYIELVNQFMVGKKKIFWWEQLGET